MSPMRVASPLGTNSIRSWIIIESYIGPCLLYALSCKNVQLTSQTFIQLTSQYNISAHRSFITKIYIAPLQGYYSEALPMTSIPISDVRWQAYPVLGKIIKYSSVGTKQAGQGNRAPCHSDDCWPGNKWIHGGGRGEGAGGAQSEVVQWSQRASVVRHPFLLFTHVSVSLSLSLPLPLTLPVSVSLSVCLSACLSVSPSLSLHASFIRLFLRTAVVPSRKNSIDALFLFALSIIPPMPL